MIEVPQFDLAFDPVTFPFSLSLFFYPSCPPTLANPQIAKLAKTSIQSSVQTVIGVGSYQ